MKNPDLESTDDVVVVDIRDSVEHRVNELQVNLPSHDEQGLADAVVEEISAAIERMGVFAQELGLPAEVSQRMQIGLDEVMVNIASYSDAESLVLRGWGDDTRLTVQVSDDGLPFNPLEAATPPTAAPLEEHEIGGLGIHLIKSLMSGVEYSFVDGRNVMTLVATVG
jgi:anti-sigma regulatory factor (Ser/Thr protein kinase)